MFLLALGRSPADFFRLVWTGAFGSWFSWRNTLSRAAPLLLTALCVAVPAQLGLVVIGGEGALVLGGLAATWTGLMLDGAPGAVMQLMMAVAGAAAGAVWLGLVGLLRAQRGINETVTSLVMAYIAIALFNQLVEGPLRDPASLNKPSTYAIPKAAALPTLPGLDVHPGILIGGVACVLCWLLIARTTTGFAARVTGGNVRAAQLQGLPVAWLMVGACALGGALAGLAGMIEVAAVHGRANASLIVGYGYSGILIAFLARQNALAIIPMAVLLGGIGAAGGLLQRRMGLPDAAVLVLQGMIFVAILASETLYGPCAGSSRGPLHEQFRMNAAETVLVAMLAGALRVSTPFLFVSLGECLTERAGRINLGNEGVLVLGAMVAYATSYLTGSPWLGVLAAAAAGSALGGLHGLLCALTRVNDVAMGIAILLAGNGIAFFFGKPFVQPSAPGLPGIPFGGWSSVPQVQSALTISPLFLVGVAVAFGMAWMFRATRLGLRLRIVGDSVDAARALGLDINRTRLLATMAASALAGVGGAFLSLVYPGSWNESLSSGQGLMAVAPGGLPRRIHAVRRGRGAGAVAAIGGGHELLLPVLCRPVRADIGGAGRNCASQPGGARHAG